jgi:hypothetical protein
MVRSDGVTGSAQSGQMMRTRRWATMSTRAEAIRYGSTPRSTSLVTAVAASFVCRLERTRWPVNEDWITIWAVSRSRISPTMMMSGSCRSNVRRPRANVIPLFSSICVWFSSAI